jgi:hypothetical protein
VEKLRAEPEMARFIGWVKKQDPQKKVRISKRR